MKLICTIDDVFNITGRGYVIAPGIPHNFPIPITIGNKILLETTNSDHKLETTIAGLEMINRRVIHIPKEELSIPFLIKGNIPVKFLSKGVKVWLIEENGS